MRKREEGRGKKIRRKSYARCRAEVMGDGFCEFGWSKKFGWNIYVPAFQRKAGMKLLVLNLVFVQFRGNYREIYRNTGKFE